MFIGWILICSACSGNKQKPENSEEAIAVEKDNIPEEAKRNLAQADIEIDKAHREIDQRFDKLLEAQDELAKAEEYANQFESGTPDYTSAQRQVDLANKTLQDIVDDVNGRYAQVLGFLLSKSDGKGLIGASRDKIKAHIRVEILEKSKQKALDELEYKYTGVVPEEWHEGLVIFISPRNMQVGFGEIMKAILIIIALAIAICV